MNLNPLLNDVKSRVMHRLPQGVNVDEVVEENIQEITDAVVERVGFALEQAMLGAQSILKTQSADYINGLSVSDDLTIEIDASVKYLEEGYGPHQMLENLITGPKSKVAKDGSLYNTIPIGKTNQVDVKRAMGNQTKAFLGKGYGAGTSRRKLQDIVSKMTSDINGATNVPRSEVKRFATASSKQDPASSWVNPGFAGVNQLDQINAQLRDELIEQVSNIVESAAMQKEL